MQRWFVGVCCAAVSVLCGCMMSNSVPFERNPYESAYRDSRFEIPRPENANYDSLKGKIPIRPVDTEAEYLDVIESGYLPLGSSHLLGRHMGWFHVMQVAGLRRADLVVINEIYGPASASETVTDLERTRRAWVSGPPSKETVRNVPRELSQRYSQTAVLMRRTDLSEMYGAVLGLPPSGTPEAAAARPSDVWVLAVMRGSQAERDGIRRGDRVTEINGFPVRDASDYSYFLYRPMQIKRLKTVRPSGKERAQ